MSLGFGDAGDGVADDGEIDAAHDGSASADVDGVEGLGDEEGFVVVRHMGCGLGVEVGFVGVEWVVG